MSDSDPQLGVSIRLMRLFDQHDVSVESRLMEQALALTCHDRRDVPFPQKLTDALNFLRERNALAPADTP